MNIKSKLLMILIFTVLILIPCSFAEDFNENQTFEDNLLNADDNIIYVSSTAEGDGDGSENNPYNLSKAVATYDSNVNSKIILKNGEYNFTNQLNLNKDITLEGESYNGVVLNGNSSSSILKASKGNIMLSNLKFINGYVDYSPYSNYYASGLEVNGVDYLLVDNCIFENNENVALSISGYSKPVIDIQNTLFDSNFVEYDWTARGAAIYFGAGDGELNIINSTFKNNYFKAPSGSGGAIYGAMNFESILIDNCLFINNTADEGSAIYSYCGGNISVFNTKFINQTQSVIYDNQVNNRFLNLFIKNLTFDEVSDNNINISGKVNLISLDGNSRISANNINMKLGEDENYTVTLSDDNGNPLSGKEIIVTLTNYYNQITLFNQSTNSSGQVTFSMKNQTPGRYNVKALFEGDDDYSQVETTNIIAIEADESVNLILIPDSIKIKEGESYIITGYITDEYYEPMDTLSSSSIVVQWEDGNVHSLVGSTQVQGDSFTFDIAQCSLKTSDIPYIVSFNVDLGIYDGYISLIQANLTVDLSVNLPDVGDLDVIYVAENGSDENGNGSKENPLASVQLALNLNKYLGGGKTIIVDEGVYDISNFNILSDVTIIGQKSKTVFRQISGKNGMFKIFDQITVNFINLTLINGYTTPMPYSLITAYGEGVIVNINGCEFKNNTCLNGAVIAVSHDASVYVDNSKFIDNKCILIQSTGGAIYVLDGYLKVSNSEFINNTACDGGAIWIGYPGTADIINSTFTDNIAYNTTLVMGGGGAIYTKGKTNIVNSSFIRNHADLYGGAVYIAGGESIISKSYFENNTVAQGNSIKGSAIQSEPWTIFNFKLEYSILLTNDERNDIALFANNEESEINLNYNYWGSNIWSSQNTDVSVSDYVIIQVKTDTIPVYLGYVTFIDVEFKNYNVLNGIISELSGYVHDYTVNMSSQLNNIENKTVLISNNIAQNIYNPDDAGLEHIEVKDIAFEFTVVESDKKDINPKINISPGNTTVIVIEVPDDLKNNISVLIKDTEFSKSCENGTITITMDTLPGNYKVVVSYEEDENYKGFSKTTSFEIPKFKSWVSVCVDDIVEEQSAYIDINVTDGATGNLLIVINGKYKYNAVIEDNGKSFKIIYDLPVGNYTVDVIYEGDSNYESSSNSTTFKVSERPPIPEDPIDGYAFINIQTGNQTTITIRVPSNLTENVTIEVNDDVYSRQSGDGIITLTIPTPEGEYSVIVNYDGDEKYNPFSVSKLFKIYDYCWFINETGFRTLREAVEAAGDGDIIKGNISLYETDETVDVGHREMPSEPWTVVKNITITSMNDDPVIIKGNTHRLFYIDKDSHLTLSNLILTGSNVGSLDGGAVENTYDAYVTIINCTFTNFTADRGGALFLWGKAEVKDSIFINNNAMLGGAIFILSPATNANNVILDNITVKDNVADSYGAGIYVAGSYSNTTVIKNSNFINNTGHGKGGAVYISDGNIIINNSLFDSNKAIAYDEDYEVDLAGGAIYISRYVNANISNSQFLNNYAKEYAGALACDNSIITFTDLTTGEVEEIYYCININNCLFTNNTADISAGAIYIGFNSLPTVTIFNSTFDSNKAPDSSAISTNFADLLIQDSVFKNNIASNSSLITTYGVYSDARYDAITRIINSNFTDNIVRTDINQINVYTNLTIENCVFGDDAIILSNNGMATLNNVVQTKDNNDYAIVNINNLVLSENTFINPINNSGTISSQTFIVVLDNETRSVEINSNYTLKAIVCDDNGNIIEKGTLVFIVNEDEITAVYRDYEFTADFNVGNGSYIIKASYSDMGLTQLEVKTAHLIAKKPINMLINMNNITVGENVSVVVNVDSQITGNISLKINNEFQSETIKNGEVKFNVSNLNAGNYVVEIIYSGDGNNAPKTQLINLSVFKVKEYLFDVKVSDITTNSAVININLPDDITGNIIMDVDGENQSVSINYGKSGIKLDNLTIGVHTVKIIFDGNEKYTNSTFTLPFTISKVESFVKINVEDVIVGNNVTINITLPDDANGDVIVNVNNKDNLIVANNGIATLTIPNLDVGSYEVNVTYFGNNKYLDCDNSTSFNIISNVIRQTTIELSIDGNYLNGVLKEIDGNPISDALIDYQFDDVINGTSITDSNGVFVLRINADNKIEVYYKGNTVFSSSSANITLKKGTFIEVPSAFSQNAVDYSAGERGALFKAIIKDNEGNVLPNKNVKIQVGNSIYNLSSDKNGAVSLNIDFDHAGTFKYIVSFDGDDKYNKSQSVTSTLTVIKKKTSISAKSISFKAKTKTKKYTVSLKTIRNSVNGKTYLKSGKKLILKVKSKTYTAKINKNGKATFKITKLTKKGNYKAIISFKGDKTYYSSSKNVKISIK